MFPSLLSIGCAPVTRSMTASRVCANVTCADLSMKRPVPSGPRWSRTSRTALSEESESVGPTAAKIPHISWLLGPDRVSCKLSCCNNWRMDRVNLLAIRLSRCITKGTLGVHRICSLLTLAEPHGRPRRIRYRDPHRCRRCRDRLRQCGGGAALGDCGARPRPVRAGDQLGLFPEADAGEPAERARLARRAPDGGDPGADRVAADAAASAARDRPRMGQARLQERSLSALRAARCAGCPGLCLALGAGARRGLLRVVRDSRTLWSARARDAPHARRIPREDRLGDRDHRFRPRAGRLVPPLFPQGPGAEADAAGGPLRWILDPAQGARKEQN